MVTSDLGSCEWFVWDLQRSGLVDRGQLDQVVGDFLKRNPRSEPQALADYLVTQGVLSAFQSERILQGKTQGLVLGPYILVDSIGQGSMGQVYRATSKTDNQNYAVKVLPRRSMWNVRLARRQVRAFSQFNNAAVVPFIDVGTAGGLHYLVWPFVEGETLEARVNREGKLAPDIASHVITQVAQGLAAAHQHGLFHGIIKPSNIMLGSDGQAKILDFGIGSLLVENEGESLVDTMSTANSLTSGLDCASPESIMEPTNRTPIGDQYSLGCTLYFCLTGRYPFTDGTAVEKMMAHQFKQATPLREVAPHLPEGLSTIVERLMQKTPESRYPGTEELVEALQPFVGDAARKQGSHFGGSHFGNSRVPTANMNSPRGGSATQAPASPRSTRPAQSQIPTPAHGVTPLPSPRPSPIPPRAPSAPANRPAPQLTRNSFQDNRQAPQRVMPTPVPPMPVAEEVTENAPPGLPPQEDNSPNASPLLVVLVVAICSVLAYIAGKDFLFAH